MPPRVMLVLLTCTTIWAGCDDTPPPPPEALQDSATQPTDGRPTTQAILSGPTKRLSLQTIPFTLEVPAGWAVRPAADGSSMSLQGPSPRFDVQIRMAQRPRVKSDRLDLMIQAVRKEAESHAGEGPSKAETRKLGPVTVLERMSTDRPTSAALLDARGEQVAPMSTPMRWQLWLFVPQGDDFEHYELSFFDLTREQYELDRQLLTRIIQSIQYDPNIVPGL